MNKLITTHNGGMPDHLENFRWYEDAVKKCFDDLAKGMANGGSAFVIWGCQIVDMVTFYGINPGAIYANGEIFQVPGHTLTQFGTGVTGTYYWQLEETYDPSGDLTFENTVQHSIYQIRALKLVKTTATPPVGYIPMALPKASDIWTTKSEYNNGVATINNASVVTNQRIDLIESGPWVAIVLADLPAGAVDASSGTVTISSVNFKVRYKKIGKTVILSAYLQDFALSSGPQYIRIKLGWLFTAGIKYTTNNSTWVSNGALIGGAGLVSAIASTDATYPNEILLQKGDGNNWTTGGPSSIVFQITLELN